MSNSPEEAVSPPQTSQEGSDALIVLLTLFPLSLGRQIGPPDLPLPEESHARCWAQAGHLCEVLGGLSRSVI